MPRTYATVPKHTGDRFYNPVAEGMHSPISRSYSNREKQQSDNSYNKL